MGCGFALAFLVSLDGMPEKSPHDLKQEIRQAAIEKGIDLSKPENAFLVARRSPQGGWYLVSAKDQMTAEEIARGQATPIYACSANPQHALLKLEPGRLETIPQR
jgi:hypothetical protein